MSHYEFYGTNLTTDSTQFDGYKFIKKLGEGVFSSVFLAEFYQARNPKEPVRVLACKVVETMKAPRNYVNKFLPRELDILRKVEHPHIIQIFAVYKKNTRYMIFMRFAENGDLLYYLNKKGAVAESQARVWTKQIALAIQYIHELEIAHRDLKCENILVTANYNVKLSDFSFARVIVNKKGVRILSETYCGSSSYAAPEVVKGVPYNPKISDIWSLGVIIFVMVNKSLPFEETNLKKLYELQIARKWKLKPQVYNVVTPQMTDLLRNILEPNVELRFTVSDVLNSEWIVMDPRLIGLSEEESLALIRAKEERRLMEERFMSFKRKENVKKGT